MRKRCGTRLWVTGCGLWGCLDNGLDCSRTEVSCQMWRERSGCQFELSHCCYTLFWFWIFAKLFFYLNFSSAILCSWQVPAVFFVLCSVLKMFLHWKWIKDGISDDAFLLSFWLSDVVYLCFGTALEKEWNKSYGLIYLFVYWKFSYYCKIFTINIWVFYICLLVYIKNFS